jgi:HNH endonuclease
MPTRMMKDLFTGEIKFIDENDIPGRFGISFNKLREFVDYNPEEGWAKWKVDRYDAAKKLWARVGDLVPYKTSINGCHIRLSHIIFVFYTNGMWAKNIVDHKDGSHDNNKIANLREADKLQNLINSKMRKHNTSGITGVDWRTGVNKWRASIRVNNKLLHLGHFDDINDARQARWDAEDKYFGEFAARHSRPRVPMKDLFSI